MTVKMYANYGTLAHEYTPVYGWTPAEAYDRVSVEIPDEYQPYENTFGELCVHIPYRGEKIPMDFCEALNSKLVKKCVITKID